MTRNLKKLKNCCSLSAESLTFIHKSKVHTQSLDVKEVRVMAQEQQSKFGFTQFAENWNGRLAMLGFVIGLATEFLTGQGILAQLGLM